MWSQIDVSKARQNGCLTAWGADNPPTAAFIEWDNGGQEWIRDGDFARLHIWLGSEETTEPKPKCSDLADALKHLLWL